MRTQPLFWVAIALLVFALGALQIIGQRALRDMGVRPSRIVIVLRAFNFLAVIAILLYALWVVWGR